MTYSNAQQRRDRATGRYPHEFAPQSLSDFDETTIEDSETYYETTVIVRYGHVIGYATRSAIDIDAPVVVELEQWNRDDSEIIGVAQASLRPVPTEPWCDDMSMDDRLNYVDVDPDPFAQALVALWPSLARQAREAVAS